MGPLGSSRASWGHETQIPMVTLMALEEGTCTGLLALHLHVMLFTPSRSPRVLPGTYLIPRAELFLFTCFQNHEPHKLLFLINYPVADSSKTSAKSGQGATVVEYEGQGLSGNLTYIVTGTGFTWKIAAWRAKDRRTLPERGCQWVLRH